MSATRVSTSGTFGRYRIGAPLGQGGMAIVHEAWIEGPDGFARRVALKRVREGAGEELGRLFSDEARIASHLHHANLVAILDYGIEGGTPFQALELVDGTTLQALRADLVARGEPMPEAIAIHVMREVAHGLAYAHRATGADGKALALVHRDVSPSNVLIGWNGDVKLSDFGIAFARGREVETAHGVARGKPSYMAPEQATRGTIDARTDVFGLGCTLHFALVGRSPLEGDGVLLEMLVGKRAPLDPALAEDVRAIVASALEPERRDRPASAEVVAQRLDAAYRARAERDGRLELKAFLGPLRKRLQRPEAAVSPSVPARVPPAAPSASGSSGRSGGGLRLASFGAATVATLALVGWGMLGGRASPTVPPAPPRSIPTATPSQDASVAPAPSVMPAPAPPSSAPVSPAPPLPPPRSRVPASEVERPRSSVVHDDGPPSPSTTGFVRVVAGCDDARGGAVTMDGRATGDQVPTTLRVPTGSHRIVVSAPDGRTFEGGVDVTAFHTEGSPAWFRACTP